jgi:cation diffusion facilitator CzcD-associated flavoprotein CzcO
MLGVDTLIVDREARVGDNWRQRYRRLVLHDPVWFDHLPYVKFPDHWPIFTPKDKLGDFFEAYVQLLELNVWTKTEMTSSSWDEGKQRWDVTLERQIGDKKETRTLHPRHIVQATGHSGKKNFPTFKGLESFKGQLYHSSDFPGATSESQRRRAIVVGSCNSGHDIAQDFYDHGYDVTMVQRSSTCVVSSEAIVDIGLKALYSEGSVPVDDADILLWSMPSALAKAQQVQLAELQSQHDRKTLEGLEKVGFKLDKGPDNAGLFYKYFQRGGGYYIDIGASQLIIDGKIKIKQGQEITEVLPDGLQFADGSTLQADEIVFATGYQNMRTQSRVIFGDQVADQLKDVWGFDDEGEFRTMWRRSGHPGFWFMGGNLALSRYYSLLVGLQIKAMELGLASYGNPR